MMRLRVRKIILSVLLCTAPMPLLAEVMSGQIVADVSYEGDAEKGALDVSFAFPVRYLRHFPLKRGDTLQIKLQGVTNNPVERELLSQRESVRIPGEKGKPFLEISYEGDVTDGPYLTIRLQQAMNFRVEQGRDFRSLRVVLSNQSLTDSVVPER